MKKTLLLVFVLTLLLSSFTFGDETLPIYLNSTQLSNYAHPTFKGDDFLVPMEEVFDSIGIQYNYREEDHLITAYRDNTFLKYNLGSRVYYKNGHEMQLNYPPVIRNGEILIPLKTISEAYDIEINHDPLAGRLDLRSTFINTYTTYRNYFYKNVDIPELNVSFDIPYYWNRINSDTYAYGIQNEYENNQLNLYAIKVPDATAYDTYLENLDNSLRELYSKGSLTEVSRQESMNNGMRSVFVSYLYTFIDESIVINYNITQSDDILYIFNIIYNDEDSSYLSSIITSIIESFKVKSFTIDTQEEHYIEYSKFHALNFTLSNTLYSNQMYRNALPFKGTIDPVIENLNIMISREDASYHYTIPVIDGSFDSKIYLPFGLGRHNISVSIASDNTLDFGSNRVDLVVESDLLLKFSTINIGTEFIRYTLQDSDIISSNDSIFSMAQYLTYTQQTNYAKAYTVYNYMLQHITIRNEILGFDPYETYLNLEGTEQGITYYYASLLRAVDIPTRVFLGTQDADIHYWTKIYLNGSWFIVDPGNDILVRQSAVTTRLFIRNSNAYDLIYEFIEEITQ
jgi:transglutaminase-like putative cysteine protease